MKNEISTAGNLIKIIEDSRNNALKKVNEELIRMYWNVGEYLSKWFSFLPNLCLTIPFRLNYQYNDTGVYTWYNEN